MSDPPASSARPEAVPPVRFVRANTSSKASSISPRAALSPQRSPQLSPRASPRGPSSSSTAASVLASAAQQLTPPSAKPVPMAFVRRGTLSEGSEAHEKALPVLSMQQPQPQSQQQPAQLVNSGEQPRLLWKSAWRRSVLMAHSEGGAGTTVVVDEAAENKQLYSWTSENKLKISPLSVSVRVSSVSCGLQHSVALCDGQRVFSWGSGALGQLGHGSVASFDQPRLLEAVLGTHVSRVAAGGYQTIVVTSEDVLWFGAFKQTDKPRLIPTTVDDLHSVVVKDVAIGYSHALVCSGSGNLFGWGCNELGQVGPNLPEFIPSPVETDSSKRVQAIAAGDCSSVSMLSGSQVFFWGSNWIKGKPGVAVKPTRVMFPRAITQISLGERHLLALADNRTVFAIGFADKGQIGTGKLQNCNDATALVFQETSTLDSVLSDQIEAVATDAEQQKSRWNNFLKRREETSSAKIVRVCCGPSFSVAVSEKGQVFYWGTSPLVAQTIASPVIVDSLSFLCCGVACAGANNVMALVDLQNTSDLIFYSFSPPIIRAARSFLVALEFFVSSKGARAELLDYILGTMWPSMCGVSELISALQSVWSALPSDLANADGRLSSFLRNLIAENVALFRPESALLVGWLSSLGPGFEETIKMLQSEAIPASAQVSSLPPGASSLDLLSYSAETIAEQLTLIDQHHLSGIRLSDLIAWARNDKSSVALAQFTQRFNQLSEFVQYHIITGSDFSSRNKRLKFWIEVHKQLFNLNNFNSSLALFASFSSVPVNKLVKHNQLEFSRSQRRWLEFFDEMINKNNRSQYRKKIGDLVRARDSGIPFLGLALSDLVFIHDGNPDFVEDGNMFNMWKKYQVAKVIQYVHHFKRTKHSALKKDSDLFSFLSLCKSELNNRQCDDLVASIVSAANAPVVITPSPSAVAVVPVAAPVANPVPSPLVVAAEVEEKPQEGRFLSLIDSPDFSKGRKGTATSKAAKRKRIEQWNDWIKDCVENREAFARRFARSTELEDMVRELLRAPMEASERAVVETVLVHALVDGVNVQLLAELLYAVAVTEPNRVVRDLVVSIFSVLKVLPAGGAKIGENADVFDVFESNEEFLQVVPEKLALLSGAPALCKQLADVIGTGQDSNLAVVALQKQADESDLERLRLSCALETTALEEKLETLKATEEELKRKLQEVMQMRMETEVELAEKEKEGQSRLREKERRVQILEANIAAMEEQAVINSAASIAASSVSNQIPFSSLLEQLQTVASEKVLCVTQSLEPMLQTLYEQYVQVQENDPAAMPVTRLNQTADQCSNVVSKLTELNLSTEKLSKLHEQLANIRLAVMK